jgi:hypothetical protein
VPVAVRGGADRQDAAGSPRRLPFPAAQHGKDQPSPASTLNIAATVVGYEILGPVPMTSNDNSVKHYTFNAETLLVVTSSEKPAVLLNLRETAVNIQMQCTLHGEITP